MNGSGVYTWPTGQYSKYEGGFLNGVKEGKGKLYVRDGRRYSGEFHKNKMHGEITEIMPSGKKRMGTSFFRVSVHTPENLYSNMHQWTRNFHVPLKQERKQYNLEKNLICKKIGVYFAVMI